MSRNITFHILSAIVFATMVFSGCQGHPCPDNYQVLKLVIFDEETGKYKYVDKVIAPDSNIVNTFNYYDVPICVQDTALYVDSTYLSDMNYIDNLIKKSQDAGWLLDHVGRVK